MSESTGFRVYPPGERPDVEVRVEDAWWPGEVRSWSPSPVWLVGDCSWHRATRSDRRSQWVSATLP